ncbi:syntaxin-7-like [Gigantopelta aegis]|uniref:syntaxin-7-like n=1 Tax=Gigantopelta aegis TaxID=1735272 RepID=UPI001B889E45|nr:syntaxin-7-like [Gigantopelta aegis]
MSSKQYGTMGKEYRDDPGNLDYSDEPESRSRFSAAELFEQIGSNISQINNGANTVDRAMKIIGTEKDSEQLRDKIHDTSLSTNRRVKTTSKLIKSAVTKSMDRHQKLQLDRLKNDFHEAVQRFQILQKKAAEKVKTSAMLLSQHTAVKKQPLVDMTGWNDEDNYSDKTELVEEENRRANLQAQDQVIENDLSLIHEREERIRQLESDILDVNEIFRDLGAMISEQGEVIDTIEANVEKTHGNVESGNQQLLQAAKYQKSSRKKMCCLLVTFVIIAVIVTIILVVTLR